MKGKFDAYLLWHFGKKLTFEIVAVYSSQLYGREKFEKLFVFKPEANKCQESW